MRLLLLPTVPILAVAVLVGYTAAAQAEPEGAPSEQVGAQAEANPADGQAESGPLGSEQALQDTPGEPQAAESEPGAASEKPVSKILINVDKSKQEMTVFVDGVEQHTWPVSTGKRGYSTPSGSYNATSMNEIWYSKEWDNAPMPHAIFYMKDGHAIHGSTEVKNLGKPASHGCVRLSPANATTLFAMVKEKGMENTEVVVDGDTPGGESKVASEPGYKRYEDADLGFGPGPGYYPPRKRRGRLGRRWFRPYDGPQGYYRPRGYYRDY